MTTATDIGFLSDICGWRDGVFLKELLADDSVRLIYADWLDEQGDTLRAEFIRVQVELATMLVEPEPARHLECAQCNNRRHGRPHTNGPCRCHEHLKELRRRERELWASIEWYAKLGINTYLNDSRIQEADKRYPCGLLSRGFISTVRLPLAAWIGEECPVCQDPFNYPAGCPGCHGLGRIHAHGPSLVRACPLERVEVSDRCAILDNESVVAWGIQEEFPQASRCDLLPSFIWHLLKMEIQMGHWKRCLQTRERQEAIALANAALSQGLLSWARSCPR